MPCYNPGMVDVVSKLISTQAELEKTQKKVSYLEDENQFLREKIRLMNARQFAPSSEAADQLPLFEAEPVGPSPEPETEEIKYNRKKPGRKGVSPDLETEEVVLDIPEAEKHCGCGAEKVRIGREETKKTEYVPAKIKAICYIRYKYACKACQGVNDEGPTVSIAPLPPSLIENSPVTPSLMTYILTSKIADSLPFYRLEKQFERMGFALNRNTMASWTITLAEKCAEIVQILTEMAKKRAAINLDETSIQVMKEENRKNTTKSHMWLLRAGPPLKPDPLKTEREPEIVLYWYQPTRSAKVAKDLAANFKGHVQTDEYKGYHFLHGKDAAEQGWVHVYCLAHVRRKFFEAAKPSHGQKRSKTLDNAHEIVEDIKAIYQAERKAMDVAQAAEELMAKRSESVLPLLQALETKIRGLKALVPPKTSLGKAIGYALDTLPYIQNYASSPYMTLDNNPLENKVRPFALGRKNWLFANTPAGAHALATWFSLVETAKANGWKPDRYLNHLLTGLQNNAPADSLLPTIPPAD